MTGALKPGVTATDLVLRVTQMLREYTVVEKICGIFSGPGMKTAFRAGTGPTIANMSPEYGATMGFFPRWMKKTVDYLKMTNRAELAKRRGRLPHANWACFYTGEIDPAYTDVSGSWIWPTVKTGHIRDRQGPQDRIELQEIKETFAPRHRV